MPDLSQETATQLPLSVTVSPWSGIRHSINKLVREFKYTSLVQVLTNFFFWVNLGMLGIVYVFLSQHEIYVNSGRGITIIPAGKSVIPSIASRSVTDLTVLPIYWQGMVIIVALVTIVAILLHWSGRPGIVPYLFIMSLFMLLLLAKMIISPILLLGGGL